MFTYFNPIFRMGLKFLPISRDSLVDGVVVLIFPWRRQANTKSC
jgi:tryptophan synthase alpha subunit